MEMNCSFSCAADGVLQMESQSAHVLNMDLLLICESTITNGAEPNFYIVSQPIAFGCGYTITYNAVHWLSSIILHKFIEEARR